MMMPPSFELDSKEPAQNVRRKVTRSIVIPRSTAALQWPRVLAAVGPENGKLSVGSGVAQMQVCEGTCEGLYFQFRSKSVACVGLREVSICCALTDVGTDVVASLELQLYGMPTQMEEWESALLARFAAGVDGNSVNIARGPSPLGLPSTAHVAQSLA